jgi:hypothetical protein
MLSSGGYFDVVIPTHKKDLATLEYCIKAARDKISGVRRIITISKEKYTNNAEWFSESSFPFNIDLVKSYVGGSCGWYFQQLLKMYAPFVIPDISENILILDSDTVFFRKVKMFDKKFIPFYNISKDTKVCRRSFDILVDEHIEKIFPEISRKNLPQKFQQFSGISHCMIFNKKIMQELFERIEAKDEDGDPFFKIFLKHSNYTHCASEYQIYFNFLLIYYPQKAKFRKLKYKNTADLNIKKYRRRFKYHYCSFHSYLRNTKGSSFRIKIGDFFYKLFKKIFLLEIWNIGIAKCSISEFLTIPNQNIHWLKPQSSFNFSADPFGYVNENHQKIIFFEDYNFINRKGKISAIKIDDQFNIIKKNKVLIAEKHLSYPYIFSDQNEKYALVESHKSKKLILYKINEKQEFEQVKIIFENLAVIDPSIIKYENKWWLFFSLNEYGDDNLYLAYSDNLLGNWQMHKKNPVKSSLQSSRMAGEIFWHEDSFYRPSQNCLKKYGASIVINKITKLNTEEYQENEEIEITPNQLDKYPDGLHNISSLGDYLTVIDGKRNKFIIYKFLIYFLRIYKKFL